MDRTTITTRSGIVRADKSPHNRLGLTPESSPALRNRWSWTRRFELWARWEASSFFQRRRCTRPFRILRDVQGSASIFERFIPMTHSHAAVPGTSILIVRGPAWATTYGEPIWPIFQK